MHIAQRSAVYDCRHVCTLQELLCGPWGQRFGACRELCKPKVCPLAHPPGAPGPCALRPSWGTKLLSPLDVEPTGTLPLDSRWT